MSEFVVIGKTISIATIRDYLFSKRIDKGDSLVLNLMDFEHIVEEIKQSGEPVNVPLNILGVFILKDKNDEVPHGKVQVVKNEKF